MWILPKQLHTLDFVQDTEALNLDSSESSMLCAQWLYVRSKASQSRTWSLKWKRDSWTRHLFGRILKRSHGKSFLEKWTSSLADTHASHLAPQGSDLAKMTQDTFGHESQQEFLLYGQHLFLLRMLTGTLASDLEKSLKSWQSLVTKRRGEYLARAKLGHHTSASGCSSWPTATTRDWKDGTAQSCAAVPVNCLLGRAVHQSGPVVQARHSTSGSRQESWATPRAGKTTDENPETWAKRQAQGDVATMPLTAQVKCWATPTARDHKSGRGQEERDYKELTPMVERTQSGKLNPRWVETLMGLPVGWTMPSCAYPVTIEPTNSDCSVTESSHPQQKELF